MNKKFSTLMALALLAGSFPVAAQFCPEPNGEIQYHSRMVKAGELDATFENVDKINQNYYYQLEVDPTTLGLQETEETTYVLSAERDYSTGKIYLTAQPVTAATLTHTLWKITVTDRAANGRVYKYENLETGYELAFDHTNALQRKGGVITQGSWDYEKDGLMDGCITNWAWYTTDEDKNTKNFKQVYAYFHNQTDSVIALQAVKKEDVWANYNSSPTTGFSKTALDGKNTGFTIVAVKDSKKNVSEFLKEMDGRLKIRPVEAGAKVLTAAEVNTMIDADGSWLTFGKNGTSHICQYANWDDANNDGAGKITKFTVWNPETNKARTIYNNPFDNKFVAVEAGQTENGYDLSRKAANNYAGYNVLLRTENKNGDGAYEYLYVSENPYEGDAFQGIYNGLQVTTEPYSYLEAPGFSVRKYVQEYTTDGSYVNNKEGLGSSAGQYYPDALQARYHWKVTYYPTRDSVVLEPLNASRMAQSEAEQKLKFEETHLAKAPMSQYLNTPNEGKAYSGTIADAMNTMTNKAAGVPVALYVMNLGPAAGDAKDYLTVGYATAQGIDASDTKWAAEKKTEEGNPAYVTNKADGTYRSAMKMRLDFVHEYSHLTRATVEDGLYFINLVKPGLSNAQTEHRVDGAYVVYDMKGHMVYDVLEEGQQDFTHMPATQWVVEQLQCTEGDALNYSEYPVVRVINREYADELFEGQLYKDSDGRLFTINHRDYEWWALQTNVDYHYRKDFNCNDRVAFNKIENPTIEGYFNAEEDVLRENVYTFQHMFNNGLGQSLVDVDGKLKVGENGTEFELFRCGVYVAEQHMVEEFDEQTGKVVSKPKYGYFDIKYKETENYGYTNAALGAEQLQKTFFKIKVKDDNLIDNDHKFVAINNQHKYVIATESEIEKNKNLSFAIVSLKENNCLDGTHGYALVNKPEISAAVAGVKEASDLLEKSVTDEYGIEYITYVDSKGKVIFEIDKNNYQTWGKLAVEAISLDTKISDLCETSTDAFALVKNNRPLYRDLSKTGYADLINNDKKAIDIRTIDEQGNASLYEDSNSPKALANKLNYLASETMGDPTQNEGFYVDKVAKSNARMPQYLFAVAADSVPAYTYCNCQVAGHNQHGVNAGCGHEEEFAGYVEGRFLVNFNDSIAKYMSNIDKDPIKANKFASDNYVRLGFVEAVHRGDSLYVLKAPYTLASLKIASQDPAENGKMYICPDSLAADKEGIIYDIVELNGKHNNVAFSLRNTGNDGEFLIESNGPSSAIGSFTGAWIKIHNYVPVLARFADENGNHNTGDGTDSALDTEYVGNMDEVINQSARFVLSAIDKDSQATANEEISTSSVVVAGVNGAVVVKGAEGKNVIVSTILGKVVANEVVSSDNVTIAAPQGVVVVSVDGESFKVVVK